MLSLIGEMDWAVYGARLDFLFLRNFDGGFLSVCYVAQGCLKIVIFLPLHPEPCPGLALDTGYLLDLPLLFLCLAAAPAISPD